MKIFFPAITILALAAFISCTKENEKPFIVVKPDDIAIGTFANEKLVFYIDVYSDVALQKFIITKKFAGEKETILLDSNLFVKNFSLEWAFLTPEDSEEDLLIFFNAIDNNGAQTKLGRRLKFSGTQFNETTGLKLYSFNSNGQSAFNLKSLQPVTLSADSTLRDLEEVQENKNNEHLSLKIGSPSGCRFVKFNDYDYGNANSQTAKSAFSAGVALSEMTNIKLNDIYIVKVPYGNGTEDTYAVLKFTGLFDNDGTVDDFYEFSVKK
jgi:hypothetical protein